MAAKLGPPALIDEFLPKYDFAAHYQKPILAPASVVYERLLVTDFSAPRVVRLLMSLRTGRSVPRDSAHRDWRQRLQHTGFVLLAEEPGAEIVLGVAGKFWRPDGGRYLGLRADDFVQFSRPGHAKAVMNFRLTAETSGSTTLSTETRIQCCDPTAERKFRLYWILVAPCSGLIRKAILKQVKTEAESEAANPCWNKSAAGGGQ